ncbi:flavodoxin [candidate division GN15 bacterium]|nr:flavodoxin [candidate division GN15 bacterium]
MKRIGVFFGSTCGNTETVIKQAVRLLRNAGAQVDLYDIADATVSQMDPYTNLILASSTWDNGELQGDWVEVYEQFCEYDFSGKTIALLALGDQYIYDAYFVDALEWLATPIRRNHGRLIGFWPIKDYRFRRSRSVEGDHFLGLAIDVENQNNLTEKRLRQWTAQILPQFDG